PPPRPSTAPRKPSTGQRPPPRPTTGRPPAPPPPAQRPPAPPPAPAPRPAPPPAAPPPPPKPKYSPASESPVILTPVASTVASRLHLGPARSRRSSIDYKTQHICHVYTIHSLLTLFVICQLVPLRILEMDFGKLISPLVPSFVWLILLVGFILILAFVRRANQCPCNYLLAIMIMEILMIFVNCLQWPHLSILWMAGVLAIVLVLNLLLYVSGMFIPLKILPGNIFMIIFTLCCCVVVISIYIIVYLNGNKYLLRYVAMVSFFYVACLTLYMVTVVHQRRHEHMERSDHVLHATLLAVTFIYMIHSVSTMVRFGQFLIDRL
ncbi:cytochrome bc complex cytochrome b subunit, partial [Drosophila ficusphila]|uniref:cytochrome bc complex cytochrome b subunit n=1 Tax=Drosophila ficusphila TaxID=30025 RepID=UPI001C88E7AE